MISLESIITTNYDSCLTALVQRSGLHPIVSKILTSHSLLAMTNLHLISSSNGRNHQPI